MAYPGRTWRRLAVYVATQEIAAGRGEIGELRRGGVVRTDRAIGERGEPTVGIQRAPDRRRTGRSRARRGPQSRRSFRCAPISGQLRPRRSARCRAGFSGPRSHRLAACKARGRACRPEPWRRAAARASNRRPGRRIRPESSCRGRHAVRDAHEESLRGFDQKRAGECELLGHRPLLAEHPHMNERLPPERRP